MSETPATGKDPEPEAQQGDIATWITWASMGSWCSWWVLMELP